jgi:hypothetical protein
MSKARKQIKQRLSAYEEEELFLVAGAVAAVASWFLVPLLLGLLAVYCGIRLHECSDRRITSAVIIFMGGSAVINWFVYLLGTL